jgi:NTP pyrophosphatase (non-canonical NTP hydrolase)
MMNISDTNANDFFVSVNDYEKMKDFIDYLQNYCHGSAKTAGWWNKQRNIAECLCLIHSEISEAMEGYRKDKMDEHLSHQKSIAVELADAMVRILDLAGGLELPLGEAFAEKFCYNQTRADHKLENRMAPGGKRF